MHRFLKDIKRYHDRINNIIFEERFSFVIHSFNESLIFKKLFETAVKILLSPLQSNNFKETLEY